MRFFALLPVMVVFFSIVSCRLDSQFSAKRDGFLVACDTITVNDSSYYHPTLFELHEQYIVHSNYNQDYIFKVLEKESEVTKVLFLSNNKTYDLQMDLTRGGFLSFKSAKGKTAFRILNILTEDREVRW